MLTSYIIDAKRVKVNKCSKQSIGFRRQRLVQVGGGPEKQRAGAKMMDSRMMSGHLSEEELKNRVDGLNL